MDQSNIDKDLASIEKKLLVLAKEERELLLKQKRLRCEKNHACDVLDLIKDVQIG